MRYVSDSVQETQSIFYQCTIGVFVLYIISYAMDYYLDNLDEERESEARTDVKRRWGTSTT